MSLMDHCGLLEYENEDLFWHGLIGNKNFIFDNIVIIPGWTYEGTAPSSQPYTVFKFIAYDIKQKKELWQYQVDKVDKGGAFINPFVSGNTKFENSYTYNHNKGILAYSIPTSTGNKILLFNKQGYIKTVSFSNIQYSKIIYVGKFKKYFLIGNKNDSQLEINVYMSDDKFENLKLIDTIYNNLATNATYANIVFNNYDNVAEVKVLYGTPSTVYYEAQCVYDSNGNKVTGVNPKVMTTSPYTRINLGNILPNGDVIQIKNNNFYFNNNLMMDVYQTVYDYVIFPKQNKLVILAKKSGTSDYENRKSLILYDLTTKTIIKTVDILYDQGITPTPIYSFYYYKDKIMVVDTSGKYGFSGMNIKKYNLDLMQEEVITINYSDLNKVYSSYGNFGILPVFIPDQTNNLDYYWK